MNKYRIFKILASLPLLAVILLVIACSAQPAPVPTTSAPIAPAKAATPTSNLPPPTSQDAAWAKVVEAAKKEGLITIYGASQFAGDGGRRTIEAFSKEYGIRVDMLVAAGRQAAERIKVESKMKQPIADLVGPGLSSATELSLAGLLDSVWQDLVLNMSFSLSGVLINTKQVNGQNVPKSYFDLLDPKWKGKMIISDPRAGAGGGFAWFAEMRFYKVLDDDYFRRFARQEPIIWGGSNQEQDNMVGRGEAWINPYTTSGTAGQMIIEGAPLKIIGMTEGSSVITDPISMVKGTVHPNASKLFLNWLLSKEGQNIYAKAFGIDSVRKDVDNYYDPRVKPQPEPQKYWPRTFEVAEASNRYHKEGIAESIFGKR
ncbi:MAG: Ferric transporter ATP-binding subunit [Dehalococcoidia bacterium]|nr:Ferric transporter ATP-binding subunit [Dehalococcoidia bacterium]